MIILLTIFQYFIQAVVDLLDKFLITARKIEPVSYTFFTLATGALLLLIWPWTFSHLPIHFIFLDLLSGAIFVLAMYVFFVALSQGEASRVVPFVFGLVPVFDILISLITGKNPLRINEFAAMLLLIPGALLVSHQKHSLWLNHLGLKTLSAALFSFYYAVWQYAAQIGPVLNNLMWNRLGAFLVVIVLLALPAFRKKVFAVKKLKQKSGTSILFVLKQLLGGANFIFLSFLLVLGKISVINSLQGFRYVFLLLLATILTHKRPGLITEKTDISFIVQKVFGVLMIFAGTAILAIF